MLVIRLRLTDLYAKNGEKETDFIGCVAFGKSGEFAEKYLKKGQQIAVCGRLQVRSWQDNEGKKRWTTEVVVGEHDFCGTKAKNAGAATSEPAAASEGFYPDESVEDDDLPF